ncbi:MAG: hypothetical protein IJZ04_07515 [Clostridia bacterium]|nr:hypothetical protein [Clostridia bacterium]
MRSSDIVILKNLFFVRITYASDRRESQCGVRNAEFGVRNRENCFVACRINSH